MQRERLKINRKVLGLSLVAILALVSIAGRVFLWPAQYPDYSFEHVLGNTKQAKNQPLVKQLFELGNKLSSLKDNKPGSISNNELREKLVFLRKICKDSCKAIRCRADPGLGHACRINCPKKTVYFCSIAVKELPIELVK
jgi:hypothetical protein